MRRSVAQIVWPALLQLAISLGGNVFQNNRNRSEMERISRLSPYARRINFSPRGPFWLSQSLLSVVRRITKEDLTRVADEHLAYCFSHGKPPLVKDLARRAGVDRSQFSRLFMKLVGESARAYLNRGRVEKAKQLLRTTNLSLEAIAYAAAFSNSTTFFRSFRRITGMKPQKYRGSMHKL